MCWDTILEWTLLEDAATDKFVLKEIRGKKFQTKFWSDSTEPYLCAHSVLLSHAKAVQIYREMFSQQAKGEIGITLNGDWAEPNTTRTEDLEAAERENNWEYLNRLGYLEFQLSWYADPVFFGDYPEVMKKRVGARLPQFTGMSADSPANS